MNILLSTSREWSDGYQTIESTPLHMFQSPNDDLEEEDYLIMDFLDIIEHTDFKF